MEHVSYGAFSEASGRVSRKHQPPVSMYFIRDDNDLPPTKLSCLYCKRTLMDGVKGTVDKVIDGPVNAADHDFACNIQCKMCGQKYRVLVNVNFPVNLASLTDAPPPTADEVNDMIGGRQ